MLSGLDDIAHRRYHELDLLEGLLVLFELLVDGRLELGLEFSEQVARHFARLHRLGDATEEPGLEGFQRLGRLTGHNELFFRMDTERNLVRAVGSRFFGSDPSRAQSNATFATLPAPRSL